MGSVIKSLSGCPASPPHTHTFFFFFFLNSVLRAVVCGYDKCGLQVSKVLSPFPRLVENRALHHGSISCHLVGMGHVYVYWHVMNK